MQLKDDLGIGEGLERKERLSFKFPAALKKAQHDVDYNNSEHTMVVQRAGWLKIDQDTSNANLNHLGAKFLRSKSSNLFLKEKSPNDEDR